MKIVVDADGCPVVKQSIELAKEFGLEALVVKNYAHVIEDDYATIVTVDISSDSADYYIVNNVSKGDIVVTQDYGLAAMALSRGVICINQNGLVISDRNIDTLLDRRHINREARRKDGKYTKFKKRKFEDDESFVKSLRKLIEDMNCKE